MPPKKDTKKADAMINFYDIMPKKFLSTPDNPNFKHHKMNIPFRCITVGGSGTGKTITTLNLIHRFSQGRKGTFSKIYYITKNKNEPALNYLETISDQIIIKEGLENLPNLDKDFPDPRTSDGEQFLVVIDDLVLAKNQTPISNYMMRCRKLNVSVIICSQSYYATPIFQRRNANYIMVLKLGGNREIKQVLNDFGFNMSNEQLVKMYEYATSEKFSPLLIDCEAPPEERFRRGFLEVLSPDDFV